MAKKIGEKSHPQRRGNHVELSVPWGGMSQVYRGPSPSPSNICTFEEEGASEAFIQERTRLHEAYIREAERTKRFGLVLAAALIALAAIVPVIAPGGREQLSYWVSAALVLFAAGTAGFTAISIKAPKFSLSASRKN